MSTLVIFGAGGFGREVADIVDAVSSSSGTGWDAVVFADDAPADDDVARLVRAGRELLDGDGIAALPAGTEYVIGIGSGAARRSIAQRLDNRGWTATTLVHPAASVGADVDLGPGTILCAGVRLTTNIRTGRHVHVNLNSTVGHDSVIGDFVTINPLVAVSGGVSLGDEVMMGTHSSILQNLSVGARSVAGAGSCVVRPVPPDTVVKGVPAR